MQVPMSDTLKPSWMENYVPVPAPPGGRFPKGVSGNPKGRPKGSLSKSDKVARALNEEGLEVVRVVLDAAKGGDMVACGHVLNRIAPNLRSKSQTVEFDFDPELPIGKQVEQVLSAVAAGQVPPDVGQTIVAMITNLASVRATEDLEARIIQLEAKEVR